MQSLLLSHQTTVPQLIAESFRKTSPEPHSQLQEHIPTKAPPGTPKINPPYQLRHRSRRGHFCRTNRNHIPDLCPAIKTNSNLSFQRTRLSLGSGKPPTETESPIKHIIRSKSHFQGNLSSLQTFRSVPGLRGWWWWWLHE